jgi:mannose-6-phosphate isomerase-like protein (cupin superfamily)
MVQASRRQGPQAYDPAMVPEARLEETETGLTPTGEGWFVLNAREARWRHKQGRGDSLPFTGWTDYECETLFSMLGVNLIVLGPGEPIGVHHWEADQEGLLVLDGEPLLLIEGQERPLRKWDYVHCPPGTAHTVIGAGERACVVLAIGSRQFMGQPGWGMYVRDELALKHGVGVEEDTEDAGVAYARFADAVPMRYQEGWLP